MLVPGHQESPVSPLSSPLDSGERKADLLLEEMSICLLQPRQSKSACKSRGLQPHSAPLGAPSRSTCPSPGQLDSSPEHWDGRRPRHGDSGLQRCPCRRPLQTGTPLAAPNSWGNFGELGPRTVPNTEMGRHTSTPRGGAQSRPAHRPRANRGPLWALGPFCSLLLLLLPAISTFGMVGPRDLGDTSLNGRPRDTPKSSGGSPVSRMLGEGGRDGGPRWGESHGLKQARSLEKVKRE